MAPEFTLELGLAIGVAVLEVALALWVYAASPGSWVNRGFALFLLATGLGDAVNNVTVATTFEDAATPLGRAALATGDTGYHIASWGMVALALAYPGRLRFDSGRRWVLGVVGLLLAASALAQMHPHWPGAPMTFLVTSSVAYGIQGIAAFVVAGHAHQGQGREGRSARLVAMGLSIYPLWAGTSNMTLLLRGAPVDAADWVEGLIYSAAGLVAAAALARVSHHSGSWRAPVAIGLVPAVLGCMVGFTYDGGANDAQYLRLSTLAYLFTSAALVAVVAYGILRQDVFTLDRKVRIAVRGSTLAGIFVAVFFIVSETAQQVFGANNPYLGIVAAGGLVFVLTPLQRVADRVANAAVPAEAQPRATSAAGDPRSEQLYATALRLALRDGRLDDPDRLDLLELADRLGIGARRAAELEASVRSNASTSRSPSPR